MIDRLRAKLLPHDQAHLLAFWDQLDETAQRRLAAQIDAVDLDLIARLYRQKGSEIDWAARARRAKAPAAFRLDRQANRFSPEQARAAGRAALERG